MKKRLFTLLLTLVLIVTCVTPITASAARITQEYAVVNLLRWAKYTQAEADIVGGWIELAYYVDLVLDTDNFDPDAPCTTAYYNTLRKRANHLFRNKIPVYPIVKIDTQPQSSSVELGDDMILIADASISDGTDTAYQWYSCADANKTAAKAIGGATYNTLTVNPKEAGVYYYFCRFSAKTAENVQPLDSDVVCVTVTKAYITVVTQPEDLNPDRGGEATLTASASSTNGRKVSYQWYSCTDERKTGATPIEGATDSVLNVPTDMYGDYYYFCRFSAEKLADVDSDVVCVDVPFMMYKDGLAQPILTYTDASVTTYTNEGSDIVRFCVYVETDYDTDGDGKLDLVKAVVQLPRAAMEGAYQAAVIYEARPYCAGENKSSLTGIEGPFNNSLLYSTAAPRTKNGTATTAEVVAAADASDFYFYENLDWYDYFLVRGYAVVLSAGPGTKGSEGFETCGSDLETDAFACIIEWLAGKEGRVAYTDKTSNIAIEADWCNGQVGMTGRSYAGTTQFGLATTGVEGLETIVPVAGLADWYECSCSQGMYLRADAYADYLAGLCASRYQDSSDWANIAKNYQYYLWHLDNDEETLYGSYGEKGGFWDIRNNTRNAANIKCPALIVHGLNDTVVYQKHFALMYDSYKKAGVDAKLLLTQNGHITLAFGENKTEQFVNGEAYQQILNRWFTYHLYDIDNGADEMAAVTVQDNVDGSWDTYPSWETNESMSMAFSPNKIISNYDSSSGITNDNFVTKYTADNTDYSTVKVIDIKEDTTIGGTIQVSVTATPKTSGENLMLTAFLVDMSDEEFNAFVIDTSEGNYDPTSHEGTEVFDIGGGAEYYTVVKLKPKSVNSKIIASGWIDLANPSAGFDSKTAVYEGNNFSGKTNTYNIYLNPTIYTVKEGHKLALVICTRDPGMIAPSLYNRPYHNMDAEYSVLISDVEATIPIYPEYTYYSTWDSAITDANNGTVGKNADATAESAVSCVYVDGNQIANVVLLRDAETAGMEIAKDMVINLNGHKLSMANGNLSSPIRHTSGNLVVDGTKKGSVIEATNSEKNTQCINVRGGSLTVNGGTYIARAGAATKEARTIQIYPGLKATLTDCDIFAYGAENGLVGGVFNYGTATLTNCRVEAYGEYDSNNNKLPRGIYSDGPLTLNNCYAYGAHSAVHVSDTTVINGGTYESPGHGGIYVFCTNKTVHIRNATVRYCDIKAGDTYIAGAIGPGMYIGGGSGKDYITVYMDNCVISSKEGEPQIVLRGTSDEPEHDNNLYISNSTLLGEKFYIRIDNLTHKLYLGAGNNFNKENTTIKALYDSNSMLPAVIETGETYDSIP